MIHDRYGWSELLGRKPAVYLAGPIDGTTGDEATAWREKATGALESRGMVALNPADALSAPGAMMTDKLAAEIVAKDLALIQASDGIIAYYPYHSAGTAMEIGFAGMLFQIPVVLFGYGDGSVSRQVTVAAEQLLDACEAPSTGDDASQQKRAKAELDAIQGLKQALTAPPSVSAFLKHYVHSFWGDPDSAIDELASVIAQKALRLKSASVSGTVDR